MLRSFRAIALFFPVHLQILAEKSVSHIKTRENKLEMVERKDNSTHTSFVTVSPVELSE
jgi:hypothetical protein